MFVGFIFEREAEGIEGMFVVAENLEDAKEETERAVDQLIDDDNELGDYEWSDGLDGSFFYTPVADIDYGYYPWGRVYPALTRQATNFSEFG